MATFSGIVQLIKDLAEQTSASDSDNLIIGSTTMKRITMANIAKYIKGYSGAKVCLSCVK